MAITFITDVKAGEPDILSPVRGETLHIKDLDGQPITTIPAPYKGWTHQVLKATAEQLAAKTSDGANAWLGEHWVGSTEV